MTVADKGTEGSDIMCRILNVCTGTWDFPSMRQGIRKGGQVAREEKKPDTFYDMTMAAMWRLTFLSPVIANKELFKSDRKTVADLLAYP